MKKTKITILFTILFTLLQITISPLTILANESSQSNNASDEVKKEKLFSVYEFSSNEEEPTYYIDQDTPVHITDQFEGFYEVQIIDTEDDSEIIGYIEEDILNDDLLNNATFEDSLKSENNESSDEQDQLFSVYEAASNEGEPIYMIDQDTPVHIIDELDGFYQIQFIDIENDIDITGFVEVDIINDKFKADHDEESIEEEQLFSIYESTSNDEEPFYFIDQDTPIHIIDQLDTYYKVQIIETEDGSVITGYIEVDLVDNDLLTNVTFDGDFNPSEVEDSNEQDEPSETEEDNTPEQEDELREETESELPNEDQINDSVGEDESELEENANLPEIASFSTVRATVANQTSLKGIALKSSTAVFADTSTSSKQLKTYPAGSILQYKSHSANWYEATVYINHKPITGYIHKSHVDTAETSNQTNYRGVALKSSTAVYQRANTNSKALKSYNQGTILQYKSFSSDWYEATVYINNKPVTGYIHKSHVENAQTGKQESYRGIALKSNTAVYQRAATNSKALKSYQQGTILQYKSFSPNWYEATVYINHKPVTGYIHKSDVENAQSGNQESMRGVAVKNKTHVYSRASTNSGSLKSYNEGSVLIYKTFSANWYEATVYINHKPVTGYIHKSHVAETLESNYDISLKEATEIQLAANAQTDQKYAYVHRDYIKNNKVTATALNVRAGPGANYASVGLLQNNDTVKILGTSGNWHQIEFSGSSQWVNASAEDISYYLDPNNFINHSVQRFQFLDLSKASGTSVATLNAYLADKGILKGHGQTFVNAGRTHNVNDAYLMSHALLETGNGTSKLATGNEVGLNSAGKATFVTASNRGQLTSIKTVYNMYGIGANDGRALEGGSIRAYEEGWTTPELAIIGGARFIGNQYIHGNNNTNTVQNTLYKMRWNPEYMTRTNRAGHQYATDIGWASKQVTRIASIYADLRNDFIVLDIPIYR